jgi:hypothetical protein
VSHPRASKNFCGERHASITDCDEAIDVHHRFVLYFLAMVANARAVTNFVSEAHAWMTRQSEGRAKTTLH